MVCFMSFPDVNPCKGLYSVVMMTNNLDLSIIQIPKRINRLQKSSCFNM